MRYIFCKIATISVLALLSAACSQKDVKWGAASAEFKSPSVSYRPVPLWFWNDTLVTEKGMDVALVAMRDASGYGGVVILPCGEHFAPSYLSDDYFDLYGHAVKRCKELGMQICLYDGYGYCADEPYGEQKSHFVEQYPEMTLKRLDKKEATAYSGYPFKMELPRQGKLMGVVAMREDDREQLIDLTPFAGDSLLVWNAPQGIWKVMIFTCVQAEEPLVDCLNTQAVEKYLETTYQKYYEQYRKDFGHVITGALFDQSMLYRAKGRVWTQDFNEKYSQKYGQSPVLFYPALWYDIGENTQAARNALFGFRSELYDQSYVKVTDEWCSSRGIEPREYAGNQQVQNTADASHDLMKSFRDQQVPGDDQAEKNIPAGEFYKAASSAAYNWDKTRVISQGCRVAGTIAVDSLYGRAIDLYTKGVNMLSLFAVWYDDSKASPKNDLSADDPLYAGDLKQFNLFLSRLNVMLGNEGRYITDVALLYPVAQMQGEHYFDEPSVSYRSGMKAGEPDYMKVGRLLSDEIGVDYMFVHPEVLDDNCSVNAATKTLSLNTQVHPQKFSVLIVPSSKTISVSNLEKIKSFYDNGGHIIFTGELPRKSAEAGQDGRIAALMSKIFPHSAYSENEQGGTALFLEKTSKNSLYNAMFSNGKTYQVMFEGGVPLRYIRKELNGKDVYLLGNVDSGAYDGEFVVRGRKSFKFWNPHTGKISAALVRQVRESDGDRTVVSLQLEPDTCVFLVEQ